MEGNKLQICATLYCQKRRPWDMAYLTEKDSLFSEGLFYPNVFDFGLLLFLKALQDIFLSFSLLTYLLASTTSIKI